VAKRPTFLWPAIERIAVITSAAYGVSWAFGYDDKLKAFGSRHRIGLGILLGFYLALHYIVVDAQRFDHKLRFKDAREKGRAKPAPVRSRKGKT
jgi:hypothetical protein